MEVKVAADNIELGSRCTVSGIEYNYNLNQDSKLADEVKLQTRSFEMDIEYIHEEGNDVFLQESRMMKAKMGRQAGWLRVTVEKRLQKLPCN